MAKKKSITSKRFWKGVIITLAIALGTWITFRIAYLGLESFMKNILGIESEMGILIAMLFTVVLILTFIGEKSIRGAIKTIFKR